MIKQTPECWSSRRLRRGALAHWLCLALAITTVCPAVAQDGEDFGITGVTISSTENFRAIISVLPHSPAADAGMKAGDTVLAINDVGTSDLTKSEFVDKMRGKPGSEVHLTILTKDTGVVLYLTLKRAAASAFNSMN